MLLALLLHKPFNFNPLLQKAYQCLFLEKTTAALLALSPALWVVEEQEVINDAEAAVIFLNSSFPFGFKLCLLQPGSLGGIARKQKIKQKRGLRASLRVSCVN